MPPLSRREFLLLGVASGATVAVGIVLPMAIATRDADEDQVTTTLGDGGAAALVAVFPRTRVATFSSLQEAVPVNFAYPADANASVLVKLGRPAIGGVGPDGDVVAFSKLCTHMGCEVDEFRAEHGVLGPCPCHFSTFDLVHGGQVTLGQATESLPQVLLDIDGDDVYATGVVRLLYGHDNTLASAMAEGGAS